MTAYSFGAEVEVPDETPREQVERAISYAVNNLVSDAGSPVINSRLNTDDEDNFLKEIEEMTPAPEPEMEAQPEPLPSEIDEPVPMTTIPEKETVSGKAGKS